MDAPQKHQKPRGTDKKDSDPLDDLELPEDLDGDVEEIDDAAILNELLRDLSPELLQEKEKAEQKPAPKGAPPVEVSEQVPRPVPSEPEPEPGVPGAISERAAAEERVEESSFEEALSALTGSEEQAKKAEEAETKAVPDVQAGPRAERARPEEAPSEAGLFTEAAIDAAFAALTGPLQAEKKAAEPPRFEAQIAAEQPAEPEEVISAETEAVVKVAELAAEAPPEEVVEAVVPAAIAVTGALRQPTGEGEIPPEIMADLSRMVAERYVMRLAQEVEKKIEAPPAVLGEAVAAPVAAEPTPVKVVPPLAEEEEEPEEIEVDLLHVAGLLTPEEAEEKAEVGAPAEAELSLDDLITSAVLTTEEPHAAAEAEMPLAEAEAKPELAEAEAEPEAEEEAPKEGEAQPEPVAVAELTGELQEDPLIREMRKQQRRRRIVLAIVGVTIITVAVVGYLLTRGPSPKEAVVAEQPPTEAVQQPQEPAPAAQAPAPEAAEAPPPSVQPPAQLPPTQATAPAPKQPAPAPSPVAAEGAPPKLPTSPTGQFTLHVESLADTRGAQAVRQKWEGRGYEVFVWEFVRPSDNTRWYRIGVGRYAARGDGEAAKQLLKTAYPDEIDWSPVTRIPEGAR